MDLRYNQTPQNCYTRPGCYTIECEREGRHSNGHQRCQKTSMCCLSFISGNFKQQNFCHNMRICSGTHTHSHTHTHHTLNNINSTHAPLRNLIKLTSFSLCFALAQLSLMYARRFCLETELEASHLPLRADL